MLDKEFVTSDIALSLKVLGFDKDCFKYFYDNTTWDVNNPVKLMSKEEAEYRGKETKNIAFTDFNTTIKAPLWQQAIDFFREKYRLDITVKFPEPGEGKVYESINTPYYDIEIRHIFNGDVWNQYKFCQYSDDYYDTRKKAIECAISEVKSLNIIA